MTEHATRTAVSIVLLVVVVLAGMLACYWPALDLAVAYEDSPITWLSTSVLVASATLALVIAEQGGGRLAYALALLLVVAALDERFMLHEQLRDWLWMVAGAREVSREDSAANLIMLAYPVAGGALVLAGQQLLPVGVARTLLWMALAVGSMAVFMDIATTTKGWQMIEEVLELAAETLFLCSLLVAQAYSGQSTNTLLPKRVPESSP